MTEQASSIRTSQAAAGEDPDSLRNRLNDAVQEPSTKLSDEREELQSAARDRAPEAPATKRRWRRRR